MKFNILVLYIFLTYVTIIKTDDNKSIELTISALNETNGKIENINGETEKKEPSKTFKDISDSFGSLGPLMMFISSEFASTAIKEPLKESPELKAINEGFENVNRKVDIITSEIRDLKNIVEFSGAKSSYAKAITGIESAFEALEEAKVEKITESYDFFAKLYERSYHMAADNLYDAFVGKLGPFGFNLVSLYKTHVKCNPVYISKFCTLGMQYIVKGLTVEGAYLGIQNQTDIIKAKQDKWTINMKTFGDSCSATIRSCEDNWKVISAQEYRDAYNKHISSNNQDFANIIIKSLTNVVPQRSWLVVAYDDASGLGEHTYSSYYEADKIWNQNKHDVTLFSAPVEETITDSNYEVLKNLIDEQKSKISAIEDCKGKDQWSTSNDSYEGHESRSIVSCIRETFKKGVVYSIRQDKNPGYSASGNTLYASEQEWKCNAEKYRVLIFM